MVEEIVGFLIRSGWSEQEVAYVRRDLPRWERHLRRQGISVIPGPQAYWSEAEDRAHDHLFLMMMQAGGGTPDRIKHRQRGLPRFSPPKLSGAATPPPFAAPAPPPRHPPPAKSHWDGEAGKPH